MKILLDKNDEKYIDQINESLRNNEDRPMFIRPNTEKIMVTFEVTDVAKANNLAMFLMGADQQEFDDLGVRVTSISYANMDAMERLKMQLLRSVEEINSILNC